MCLDLDGVIAADSHVAVARDALAAVIGGREVDVEVTSTDDDIGISLDGCAV